MEAASIQDQKMAKAYALLSEGRRPTQVDEETFTVPSQTGNWLYNVKRQDEEYHCDCPDHNKREAPCKHILLVKLWLGLKDTLKEEAEEHEPLASILSSSLASFRIFSTSPVSGDLALESSAAPFSRPSAGCMPAPLP